MRKFTLSRSLFLLAAIALLACFSTGCGELSVEESCDLFCEKFGACNEGMSTPAEIEGCKSECSGDINRGNAACHDAFAAAAECVDSATCEALDDNDNTACMTQLAAMAVVCPIE